MTKKEFNANKKYLLEDCKNIFYNGDIDEEKSYSAELESYTKAGGDMIIYLKELDKENLQDYIDNFNINDEVIGWWRDGEVEAHNKGVPFNNIKEHYEDVQDWLRWLEQICNGMPY